MNPGTPLDRKFFLLSMILLALIVLIAGGMGTYVLSDPGIGQAYMFARAATKIVEQRGSNVTESDLIASALRAIFDRMDRYSSYVSSAQFDRLDEELSGHYSGIGVSVIRHEHGLLIMSVRENGPAGKAGFRTGDVIIAADSVEFTGISADSASNLLRGKEGTPVLVRLLRPATVDTIEVKVTRQRIPLMHIPYAGYKSDSIVYIRLLDFEAGASADVEAAIDSLISKSNRNNPRPKGLILDLRGNPGGLLAEAHKTADLFLDKGTFIVGTDARSRWNEKKYYATGKDLTDNLPLVVLVDRGSASSAEIVAGALREAGRAVLIGDTTFGKGLVQGFTRFPDGDGLKLTIARYYLDNDVFLNDFDSTLKGSGHGLTPDYYFPPDETHSFVRALESSLLLQQFANKYQEEIIAATDEGNFENDWIDRLAASAQQNHFTYTSLVTRLAELGLELTREGQASMDTRAMAEAILETAQKDDQNQFYVHAAYIKARLKQIAFERKFGTYRAYRDIIVREQTVIQFASQVLLERN